MSEMKRLLADDPTELEASLLSAVRGEAPSAAQRARVQEALGISAGHAAAGIGGATIAKFAVLAVVAAGAIGGWVMTRAPRTTAPAAAITAAAAPAVLLAPVEPAGPTGQGLTTTPATAPITTPAAAVAPSIPPPNAVNAGGPLPRRGAISGRAALGAGRPASGTSAQRATSLAASDATVATTAAVEPQATSPAAAGAAPATTQAVAATPSPANSPAQVNTPPTATNAPTARPSDLRDQIGLIDGARAALARRDPKRALALLDQYTSRYPSGAFRPEASVLRIEALDQNGDHARASSLGRSFLADNPKSTHAERVERVVGH